MPLRLRISKQIYDRFDDNSREGLEEVSCDCVVDSQADADCEVCEGGGINWEWTPSQEVAAAIEENLRSQGMPLGKNGLH